MFRKLLFVFVALAFSLAGVSPVFANGTSLTSGAVYIQTNSTAGNQVIAYNRASDGTLTLQGAYDTGGLGSGVGITVPPDPLGSQNSLLLSDNGQWLFAVNAGSDSVSVFRVRPDGLELTDVQNSRGDYPVSLTFNDHSLYVLNAAGDGSISGFNLDHEGKLDPIHNSTRSLHAATPDNGGQPQILEAPAQVAFSPDGQFLIVTDKGGVSGTGRILVFKVRDDRPADQPAITTTTNGPVPFAMAFDKFGHLVVIDAATGSVTSFEIHRSGSLSQISVVFSGQAATCWIASNGKYLFTDNTGSGSISAYSSSHNGSLTVLNNGGVAAVTGAGTLPLDVGISHNGNFLYSLEVGAGAIGMFQIGADGSLTSLGTLNGLAPVSGYQGIAVR